ncbi:hypothetical protein C8A00DRAFT_15988, partial [Chaetomidium leptoderma]
TWRGGRLIRPTETSLLGTVWLHLASASVTAKMVNELSIRSRILVAAPRIVLHQLLVRWELEVAVTPSSVGVQSKEWRLMLGYIVRMLMICCAKIQSAALERDGRRPI